MSERRLPERLRRQVLADLRPVRPLPPPAVRAAEVALWAVALFLIVPAVFPLRRDGALLGWLLMWGAAAAECLTGILLVGLALREAVPGAGLGRGRSLAALIAGVTVQAMVGVLSWVKSPPSATGVTAHHSGAACFASQSMLALPALALAMWLVVRALPVRPRWAGALAGLGAGLMADGVWHLICPLSNLEHLLLWHGGATALLTLAGWLLGLLWERREAARLAG
ncbi:MAG: NrsF family protein [Acidobacteriota bacterium]